MKTRVPYGSWGKILTREFIEHQHFVLRKSTTTIANEIGTLDSVVCRYGKKHGITFLKDALKVGRPLASSTKFVAGFTPWNKGKRGIKCGPLGQKRPRGKDHFNWKGGARDRDTIEYKQWRTAVYKRDGYTCQHCSQRGGKLNAHHVKPWKSHPELRYSVTNGITLCRECHKREHAVSS